MVASIEQYASEFEPPYHPPKRTQADLDPSKSWGGWTLLDQQVALLKGWEFDPMEGAWWMSPEEKAAGRYWCGGLTWTSDDAKALELVDELVVDQPDGAGCRFMLIKWEPRSEKPARWEARFEPYWIDGKYTMTAQGHRFDGQGQTRPEAICRAYIAAREWMAGRGKS